MQTVLIFKIILRYICKIGETLKLLLRRLRFEPHLYLQNLDLNFLKEKKKKTWEMIKRSQIMPILWIYQFIAWQHYPCKSKMFCSFHCLSSTCSFFTSEHTQYRQRIALSLEILWKLLLLFKSLLSLSLKTSIIAL